MSKGHQGGVAIVGFGAVFPGSPSARSFWRLVAEGRDATTEVPEGRWPLDPSSAYDPKVGRPDHVYTTRGGFVDDEAPDLDGLNIDPALVERLDPVFRLALRAAGEAWRSARTESLDRSKVGTIFGNIVLPTETTSSLTRQTIGREIEAALGVPHSESDEEDPRNAFPAGLPAELVAKALGLGGVAFTLDAACASSLYALKLACDELLSGRADAMIAGGLSRPDALYTQMGFSQLRALSPRGRAAPFDAEGDGLIVGEGAGLFILKRLEDAERQGDAIHGVIRGIGLSNDVQGDVLAPSGEGQLRAMRAAYEQAGWSPAEVDLIECHATGTPVGDAVEFESLKTLWSDSGAAAEPSRCALGSVKSNVGHALTAAGAAGLLKVLLAMRHQAIPPIVNHHSASPRLGLEQSPFRILKEAEPWPSPTGRPRRAAISGFGFGGINAHVLIEEWTGRAVPADDPKSSAPPSREPVAIVGASARFGRLDPEAFRRRALGGEADAASRALDELRVRMGRFRIPPRELEEMLLQQSLMLQVAADAIADAKWSPEAALRTSVLVGLGLDLNTTNYHLRWWLAARAPAWNKELGWGLSPEELDAWVAEARDAIQPALSANRTMGSLGGLVASRIAREFRIGGPSFSVSSDENSGLDALRLAADWLARGEIDSAIVGAVDLAGDLRLALAARRLLGEDLETGDGAVALVLKREADAIRDGDRILALIGDSFKPTVLIDPPRRRIGWTGAAEGLTTVATAALGLEHAIIPPEGRYIEASPSESPNGPRYWLQNRDDGPRRALVRSRSLGGAEQSVELEGVARSMGSRPLGPSSRAIFAIRGDDFAALGERVEALSNLIADSADSSIDAMARRWWRRSRGDSEGRLGLALTADDPSLLAVALKTVRDDVKNGRPIGRSSVADVEVFAPVVDWDVAPGVALAYPGLGNVYPGMGAELSALWPELMEDLETRFESLRDQFAPEAWWSGRLPERFEDHRPAILGQISVGALTTSLFLKLGVKPMAAVGYSMGESAALVALGAWPDRDELARRLLESPLFVQELAGPCLAARRAWGLADSEPVDWVAGIVPRSREEVEAAIGENPHVYVLIRNADDETVIGGHGDSVRRVAEALRCPLLPLPLVSTVHCPIGAGVEPAYRALHDQKTNPIPNVSFYSGVWGRAYSPDRKTTADAITAQAGGMIDFPKVVEGAYAEGARVFLEMGPGSSCSRLVGRILGDRPHLAVSAQPGEGSALAAVLRAVGTLIAAGVSVDLGFLYDRDEGARETDGDQKPQREITIRREGVPNRPLKPPRRAREAAPVSPPPSPPPAPIESTPLPNAALETVPSMSNTANAPAPLVSSAASPRDSLPPLTRHFLETQQAAADAHEAYLRLARGYSEMMGRQVSLELDLIGDGAVSVAATPAEPPSVAVVPDREVEEAREPAPQRVHPKTGEPIVLDRDECLEFAIGSIAAVLGPEYAAIDSHPTRVRLPDEPLMLVDRVVSIEGTLHSLTTGRVVTEHDVKPGAWYLDGGRAATCVAIESGQADLFLAGYLGMDFITKGLAVYRLLDATVTFHRPLPEPGETVRYDIKITNFFRQDETHLFRFEFTATIDGEPMLTMRDGCAGFFSAEELASGKGIVPRPLDSQPRPGVRPDDWRDLAPMASTTLDRHQVDAIRAGNLFEAFGAPFDRLDVARPIGLPGDRMALVDRVVELEPNGGRFGLGLIRAEADIHPDDWFLTCHFVDDRVMPGTLMYECCLHTMRILLMRMGWVGPADSTRFEPVPGVANRLRCRGQVIETTKVAAYEVVIKEVGYGPEPYAIADALMFADGKPIVEINDMALRLSGSNREELERLWERVNAGNEATASEPSKLVYEQDQILAFATGAPSAGFGDRYRPFDQGRFIARLPRPPYLFLDRATILQGTPWVLAAGTIAEGEYAPPADAWYFEADDEHEQARVPHAIVLETALQSCGFVAAFMGSALTSDGPLKFRNLRGRGRQLRSVDRNSGPLRTIARVVNVSRSAGMFLQHYEMEVHDRAGLVFEGEAHLGFFHPDALADQPGLRDPLFQELTDEERGTARSFPLPGHSLPPGERWRMIDHVDALLPDGGPHGLGLIEGSGAVDSNSWVFQAHFLDDPVWPGSLGLESLLQLLKVFAGERWDVGADALFDAPALGVEHDWTHGGQIGPNNRRVTTRAVITAIDDEARRITADGALWVDGKIIYRMNGFSVGLAP